MAPSKDVVVAKSNALTTIDPDQTLKASKALLAHIKKVASKQTAGSTKRNLLHDGDSDSDAAVEETPVWLTLTTKRHIADKTRLKPGKIPLPHSLHADETSTICLITADPQRAYKMLVASEAFPAELGKRITRVIDFGKIKAKFTQYEAQRKLFSEHDIFMADERIINRLPKALGKTFYKTTQKRPIPVILAGKKAKADEKRPKPAVASSSDQKAKVGTPAQIAKEINKALTSALVSLSPTTNTTIRVGWSHWSPEQIAANVEAVTAALVARWVPQQWRNVRSVYIKGPETAALPIWLTDELWVDGSKDVIADPEAGAVAEEAAEEKGGKGKKRKAGEGGGEDGGKAGVKKVKKALEGKLGNDESLNKQIAQRKETLRKQKAAAKKALED